MGNLKFVSKNATSHQAGTSVESAIDPAPIRRDEAARGSKRTRLLSDNRPTINHLPSVRQTPGCPPRTPRRRDTKVWSRTHPALPTHPSLPNPSRIGSHTRLYQSARTMGCPGACPERSRRVSNLRPGKACHPERSRKPALSEAEGDLRLSFRFVVARAEGAGAFRPLNQAIPHKLSS
jgi:hypothetical protein